MNKKLRLVERFSIFCLPSSLESDFLSAQESSCKQAAGWTPEEDAKLIGDTLGLSRKQIRTAMN